MRVSRAESADEVSADEESALDSLPSRGAVRGELALALARAVVGVVEALALEVDGGRVQHALTGTPVSGSLVSGSSLKDC